MEQTGSKQHEKLNTTDKQPSNSDRLIEIIEIPETPFAIVKEGETYTVVLGEYKLSQPFNTEEEARTDAERKDWGRWMQVMHVMVEKNEKIKEIFNQNNTKK